MSGIGTANVSSRPAGGESMTYVTMYSELHYSYFSCFEKHIVFAKTRKEKHIASNKIKNRYHYLNSNSNYFLLMKRWNNFVESPHRPFFIPFSPYTGLNIKSGMVYISYL